MTRRLRSTLLLATVLAVVFPLLAAAQEPYYNVRPAVLRDGGWTAGARWEAGLSPRAETDLALSFPREWTFRLDGKGAVTGRPASNPEPLLGGEFDVGMQVLLLKQRPCLPDDCPDDLVDFNLGYVMVGLQVSTQLDQRLEEGIASVGGALRYRPLGLQHGAWPLVPSVSVAYMADKPFVSETRDTLGVDSEVYGRLDLEAIWHVRFARSWVPSWVHPGRVDVTIAHYRQVGLDEAVEQVVEDRGLFASVDLGYELTGRMPWLRQVFLRWSTGEHPVRPDDQQTWMLGLVLGETR